MCMVYGNKQSARDIQSSYTSVNHFDNSIANNDYDCDFLLFHRIANNARLAITS